MLLGEPKIHDFRGKLKRALEAGNWNEAALLLRNAAPEDVSTALEMAAQFSTKADIAKAYAETETRAKKAKA